MTSPLVDRAEGVISGKAIKVPARVATTANITLSGLQTIDDITLVADDRVLVKDQTTGSENGIYVVASGTWARADDFDGENDITQGTLARVLEGTSHASTTWELTTASPVIGTSSLTFTPTNVTLSDTELLALAALSSQADRLPYFTGVGTMALLSFPTFGRTLASASSAFAARGSLNVNVVGPQLAAAISLPVDTEGTFHEVTGSGVTIQAFDGYRIGEYKELEFLGANTLQDGSGLETHTRENVITAAGDISGWRQTEASPAVWQCLWYTQKTPPEFPTFLRGLELSELVNATSITVSAGKANDSTDAVGLELTSAMSKVVANSWVAGSGNGGLSSSLTMASSTWYHVFIVRVGGSDDIMLDTDVDCANGIADHSVTHYRRIASVYTSSPTALTNMIQVGDYFQWTIASTTAISIGTSGGNKTILVPPDVDIIADLLIGTSSGSTSYTLITKPGLAATVDVENTHNTVVAGASTMVSTIRAWTNTGQVFARQSNDTGADSYLRALSWTDRRGKQY